MLRRLIDNLLTIRSSTFEDFVEALKKQGCTEVTAYPGRYPQDVKRTSLVGMLGSFSFRVQYVAETLGGRPLVFDQENFVAFGTEYGFDDSVARAEKLIRNNLLAQDGLDRIKGAIPTIQARLIAADDSVSNNGGQRIQLFSV